MDKTIFVRRAALVGFAVCALLTPAQAQQTSVKVGIVYSFSGASSVAGKQFDDTLAVFQRAFGESAGGRKVEFIRRDDGGISPDRAKRLAQELIVQDHVDMISGLIFTPNAMAVAAISTQAKMPVFIMNATTSGIMTKNPYMSRYSYSATQATIPLARYAYASGVKNMYALYLDYGPGIDSGQTFEKTFMAEGGKIDGEIRMPLNTTDFSAYLQRVKDAHPGGIYIFLNASGIGTTFLRQAKLAGLERAGIKIFCSGDLVAENALAAIGDSATGVISAMNYSDVHGSRMNRDFVKAYLAQSGGERPSFASVGIYDAFRAIYKVIESQPAGIDPDKTMALVKTLKFESPRGPIEIDPDSRDIVQTIYIRRTEMKNGQLQNTEITSYPAVKDPSE